MGLSGKDYYDHQVHRNPMSNISEKKSPLKEYEHLLPESSSVITSLDQHLFLVNVSTLFTAEPARQLRLLISKTEDKVSGPSKERELYYASIILLSTDFSISNPGEGKPGKVLIRGPAVPYYTQTLDPTGTNQKSWWSQVANRNHLVSREIREVKEQAMALLMKKLEEETHKLLEGLGSLEVWNPQTWKLGRSPTQDGDQESVASTLKVSRKSSGWFAK